MPKHSGADARNCEGKCNQDAIKICRDASYFDISIEGLLGVVFVVEAGVIELVSVIASHGGKARLLDHPKSDDGLRRSSRQCTESLTTGKSPRCRLHTPLATAMAQGDLCTDARVSLPSSLPVHEPTSRD